MNSPTSPVVRDYATDFVSAIERSVKWRLLHPLWLDEIPKAHSYPKASDVLPAVCAAADFLQDQQGLTVDDVRLDCARYHFLVWLILKEEFGLTTFPTIGDVDIDGKPQWGTSIQYLKREARGANYHTSKFDAHVWLTTGDMEVVDATIFPYLSPQTFTRWSEFIHSSINPSRVVPDIRYRPMLVSPDILERLMQDVP